VSSVLSVHSVVKKNFRIRKAPSHQSPNMGSSGRLCYNSPMTTVAHTAIGLFGWQRFSQQKSWKRLLLFVIIASLPDIDFGLYLFMGKQGLALHQYYTHNVFFVFIACLLCWPMLSNGRERAGLMLTGFSHLVIDFFTIDGAAPFGFPLFYPFWDQRFNFGILPNIWKANLAEVFSVHNVMVVGFEVVAFWAPLILIYRKELLAFVLKRNRQTLSSGENLG